MLDDRSPRDVLEDHLRVRENHAPDDDAQRNYAEDVVLLTGRGIFHGHNGVRQLARSLKSQLPNGSYHYHTKLIDGELAFLEWTARAEGAQVDDGVDSFLIRNGKIVAQTIHYTITHSP